MGLIIVLQAQVIPVFPTQPTNNDKTNAEAKPTEKKGYNKKIVNRVKLPLSDANLKVKISKVIYGPTVSTPELNYVRYQGNYSNKPCYQLNDTKGEIWSTWCFQETFLEISVPNSKWAFVGVPEIDVVEDDHGSAKWNKVGASDRFFITLNTKRLKQVRILTNSNSFKVRLKCIADYYE